MLKKGFLFVLVLLATSELVLGEKFSLKGKGNASALVKDKKLELKVERGPIGDYSVGRKFELSIGGCKIAVEGSVVFETKVGLQFTLEGKEGSANNPDKFVVKGSDFEAYGDANSKSISCDFKFKQIGDEYKIDVGLSGDVPPGFKLSSEMAELYIDPNIKKGKVDAALIGGIIGALIIALAVILGSSVFGGFLIRRYCRKQQEKKERDRLKTAISVENKAQVKPELKVEINSDEPKKADKVEVKKTDGSKEAGGLKKAGKKVYYKPAKSLPQTNTAKSDDFETEEPRYNTISDDGERKLEFGNEELAEVFGQAWQEKQKAEKIRSMKDLTSEYNKTQATGELGC